MQFIPFFNSSLCNIADVALHLIISVPQTAATTFAFSSVFSFFYSLTYSKQGSVTRFVVINSHETNLQRTFVIKEIHKIVNGCLFARIFAKLRTQRCITQRGGAVKMQDNFARSNKAQSLLHLRKQVNLLGYSITRFSYANCFYVYDLVMFSYK